MIARLLLNEALSGYGLSMFLLRPRDIKGSIFFRGLSLANNFAALLDLLN